MSFRFTTSPNIANGYDFLERLGFAGGLGGEFEGGRVQGREDMREKKGLRTCGKALNC